MFTGIIQEIGVLSQKIPSGKGSFLDFSCSKILPELKLGDSVCCNGICLSVTQLHGKGFKVFAVEETLRRTNLKDLRIGEQINLELALLPDTRLGGHYVTGHVDGTAIVSSIKVFSDKSRELSITYAKDLRRYFIEKGSIAINGVSLTIAHISGQQLTLAIIPITLEHTNLLKAQVGTRLNIEVDMMGKYIENFLNPYISSKSISKSTLASLGYNVK